MPGKLLPALLASARSPALMKCPESRPRDNPAPLGEKQQFQPAQHWWCRAASAPAALCELHRSLGGADGERIETQCSCPQGQAAECVSKAPARPDLGKHFCTSTLLLVRNGSKPRGSGNGVRHLQWWHKAHHLGRGQCRMLQHLGFF